MYVVERVIRRKEIRPDEWVGLPTLFRIVRNDGYCLKSFDGVLSRWINHRGKCYLFVTEKAAEKTIAKLKARWKVTHSKNLPRVHCL